MKKKFKNHKHLFCSLLGTLFVLTFLAYPALAEEITLEQKLRKAEELSMAAPETASKAKETGDVGLAQKALDLAWEASTLLSELSTMARVTGDPALAQAVMNLSNTHSAVINQIIDAVQYIVQTETDPGAVDAGKEILVKAEELRNLNESTIETALAAGAIPGPGEAEAYRPPERGRFESRMRKEKHIHDHEPASPIQ